MTYDCMTPDELALWQAQVARARVQAPCVDCPLWFHLQEQAAGRCNAHPRFAPRVSAKRREQLREATRRYRAAQRTKAWKAKLAADVMAIRAARAGVQ